MNQRLFYFLMLVGSGLVLYLSWLPAPKMGLIWFIPGWLAQWADENRNDTIRTAVPLVFLGLLAGWQLVARRSVPARWLAVWLVLTVVVVVAEVGQLLLAHRSFDVLDIVWGAAGAALGLVAVAAGRAIYWLASGRLVKSS